MFRGLSEEQRNSTVFISRNNFKEINTLPDGFDCEGYLGISFKAGLGKIVVSYKHFPHKYEARNKLSTAVISYIKRRAQEEATKGRFSAAVVYHELAVMSQISAGEQLTTLQDNENEHDPIRIGPITGDQTFAIADGFNSSDEDDSGLTFDEEFEGSESDTSQLSEIQLEDTNNPRFDENAERRSIQVARFNNWNSSRELYIENEATEANLQRIRNTFKDLRDFCELGMALAHPDRLDLAGSMLAKAKKLLKYRKKVTKHARQRTHYHSRNRYPTDEDRAYLEIDRNFLRDKLEEIERQGRDQ